MVPDRVPGENIYARIEWNRTSRRGAGDGPGIWTVPVCTPTK
jgi:hypothetical protein